MASPPNPVVAPVVTYEYLFYLLLSERPWPPSQQQAQGLLSGPCTLGTVGHWLRPKNLDTAGSL
jgi:hypothetical protein